MKFHYTDLLTATLIQMVNWSEFANIGLMPLLVDASKIAIGLIIKAMIEEYIRTRQEKAREKEKLMEAVREYQHEKLLEQARAKQAPTSVQKE
mgnify:CR=1 FL=1|jgi:hypothetical protein